MYNRAKAETVNQKMTMEQHTAMMILAKYRHSLHCSEDIVTGKEKILRVFTDVIPRMMKTVGLPRLVITVHTDVQTGNKREVVEEVNSEIEDYMELIDSVYGTGYRPSGYLRQVYAEKKGLNEESVPA